MLTLIEAIGYWEKINESPYDPTGVADRAALFCIGCIGRGNSADRVADDYDLDLGECQTFKERLELNDIISGEKTSFIDWIDEETGDFTVVMDVLCAAGVLKRACHP